MQELQPEAEKEKTRSSPRREGSKRKEMVESNASKSKSKSVSKKKR
jgi:hypothetical protein